MGGDVTVDWNGWTLAEQAGELCPEGMQRVLNQADWSADAVRDDVRGLVFEHLGAEDGVPAVDETGFIKKGTPARPACSGGTERGLPCTVIDHGTMVSCMAGRISQSGYSVISPRTRPRSGCRGPCARTGPRRRAPRPRW
jgi:hypothetical protein